MKDTLIVFADSNSGAEQDAKNVLRFAAYCIGTDEVELKCLAFCKLTPSARWVSMLLERLDEGIEKELTQ